MVSAVVTPIKLRTATFLVPLLVMIWAMNPIGGQLSLRVVSKETNVTTVDVPFSYISPDLSYDMRIAYSGNPSSDRVIDNVFATSLFSPNSSKNGTQDIFGNIQIPLLEYLMLNETLDPEGWVHTTDRLSQVLQGVEAAIADAAGITHVPTKPIYASIIGLPYKANLTSITLNAVDVESKHDAKLQDVKNALFGEDVANTQSEFTIDTSYMYANCTTKPILRGPVVTDDNSERLRSASHFPNTTNGVANSGNGFSIAYDRGHSQNSTTARTITVRSWLGLTDNPELDATEMSNQTIQVISEASCTITQTYVEAQVWCISQNNCTVAKIRESKKANMPRSPTTALDGITIPITLMDQEDPEFLQEFMQTNVPKVASTFFDYFVNATAVKGLGNENLGPLESYFARPDAPFKASLGATGASSGQTG